MTQFDKSKFSYHGGYLMYRGDYEGRPVYPDGPNVHPTMVGRGVDLFIARFKHKGGYITKAKFMKELCESFTVEEFAVATTGNSLSSAPINVLKDNNPEWYENIMSKWLQRGQSHLVAAKQRWADQHNRLPPQQQQAILMKMGASNERIM